MNRADEHNVISQIRGLAELSAQRRVSLVDVQEILADHVRKIQTKEAVTNWSLVAFESADIDRDGFISFTQFQCLFERLHPTPSRRVIEIAFRSGVHSSMSNQISRTQFIGAATRILNSMPVLQSSCRKHRLKKRPADSALNNLPDLSQAVPIWRAEDEVLEVGPDLRNRWKRRLTAAEKRFCATQMGVAHTVLDTVAEHWTRWAASINFYVDTMNHAEDQSSNEMAIRISRARNELCTALSREVTEVTSDTAMSLQTNLSYNQGSVRNTVHRAHSALYWFRKILTLVSEHQADLRFRLGLVGCSVSGLEPELKALESVIHLRWSGQDG